MTEMCVQMGEPPEEVMQEHPAVGDVYRKRGGPYGFMIIVSNNGSTHHYIAIDREGKVTGVGQGTEYYFSRRDLVGYVEEFPEMKITWDR